MNHEWRRLGAASATVSAGALVFFSAGTTPASAEPAGIIKDCKLGSLLCGLLGSSPGQTATPPPSPGGGQTSKPSAPSQPKPKPKPVVKAKPAAHPRHAGSSGTAGRPAAPPADVSVPFPAPDSQPPMPSLPDVTSQDPVVIPEAAPERRPSSATLVAAGDQADGTISPLLVATASGLIGAVAALNLSVLGRRRR